VNFIRSISLYLENLKMSTHQIVANGSEVQNKWNEDDTSIERDLNEKQLTFYENGIVQSW
jgi:hypothetical protein